MNMKMGTRGAGEQVAIVSLGGEVDIYTSPRLKHQIHSLLDRGHVHLLVDLSEVEYMDSTGLGVLIGCLKRARERSGSLGLTCANDRIRRLFEITGLIRVFDLYQSESEALAAIETSRR